LGQKVHPIGFRLGITKDWQSRWYADKHYTVLLQEDLRIRKVISTKYKDDDIARVEIERASNQVTVTVHTSRPGIVIGRGGQRVDETRSLLEQIAGKRVRLNIQEVSQPELDACLVARSIAQQMERRISHRRAMKQAIFRAMERGAQGIKIVCAGRVGSSEYARTEQLHEGRVPLHTLRADIDYATATAHTTLGTIGVKVYIYKGDIIPEYEKFNADAAVTVSNKEKPEEKAEGAAVNRKVIESVEASGKTEELVIPEEHEGLKEGVSVDGTGKPEVAESASKSRSKVRTRVKSVSTTPETKVEKEEKPKTRGKAKDKAKTGLGESSDTGATAVISEKEQKESKPKPKAKIKADTEKESGKD
jgi:small subunit ribosomal protein S3